MLPRKEGAVERTLDGEDAHHVGPGHLGFVDAQVEGLAAAGADDGDVGQVGVGSKEAGLVEAARQIGRHGVGRRALAVGGVGLLGADVAHEVLELGNRVVCVEQRVGELVHVEQLGRGRDLPGGSPREGRLGGGVVLRGARVVRDARGHRLIGHERRGACGEGEPAGRGAILARVLLGGLGPCLGLRARGRLAGLARPLLGAGGVDLALLGRLLLAQVRAEREAAGDEGGRHASRHQSSQHRPILSSHVSSFRRLAFPGPDVPLARRRVAGARLVRHLPRRRAARVASGPMTSCD